MDLSGILQKHFISNPVTTLGMSDAFAISPDASVQLAIEILREENCGSLVINNQKDEIIGILTERDIICRLPLDGQELKVSNIMTPDPEVIRKSGSVARALHMLSIGGYRHLPVVHRSLYVENVISVRDVISYIYDHLTKDHDTDECELISEGQLVKRYFCSTLEIFEPRKPITVGPQIPTIDVINMLRAESAGCVLIADEDDKVAGIFTDRDFLKHIAGKSLALDVEPIASFMTPNPQAVELDMYVVDAYNTLQEGGFRHLPVVNSDNTVAGILSIKDFLDRLVTGMLTQLEDAQSKDNHKR